MLRETKPYHYLLIENRIQTFKNWPFKDNSSCSALEMAKAGFIHEPTKDEPDAVYCFICHKELDGWSSDDIPLQEHRAHSNDCPFLNYAENDIDMLNVRMEDILKLLCESKAILIRIIGKKERDEIRNGYNKILEKMDKLIM